MKQHVFDMTNVADLERVLSEGVDFVVHCAHAPLPIFYPSNRENDQMWNDNCEGPSEMQFSENEDQSAVLFQTF